MPFPKRNLVCDNFQSTFKNPIASLPLNHIVISSPKVVKQTALPLQTPNCMCAFTRSMDKGLGLFAVRFRSQLMSLAHTFTNWLLAHVLVTVCLMKY